MKHVCFLLFLLTTLQAQAQTSSRTLAQLVDKDKAGWTTVSGWIKDAKNKVEVLPKTQSRADAALVKAQVTTKSPMGAIIYETGGLLVDDGWIKILGSGSPRLNRSLMDWNKGKSFQKPGELPSFLLVADDALGGFYAINAGGLSADELGAVFYFSPDNLLWESSGLNYSQFIQFCLSGNLGSFYEGMRWKNWREEVKKVPGDKAFHFFPYLWMNEGKDIEKVSRKPVPVEELWGLYVGQKK